MLEDVDGGTGSRPLRRDEILLQIRELILTGKLSPGTRLFEQELAEKFGASKSPVRDALHRLQVEGLVDVMPRKGYLVRPISLVDAVELYEMREIMEIACVERSCRAASSVSLGHLDRFRSGPGGPSMQDWLAYDSEFHGALARLSGSSRMTAAAQAVIKEFERLLCVSVPSYAGGSGTQRGLQRIVQEHSAIINAVQDRDGRRARGLLRTHIEASRRQFLGSVGATADAGEGKLVRVLAG